VKAKGSSTRVPWLLFGLASIAALAVVLVGFRAQGLVDNLPDPYWFSAMGSSLARGEGLSAYGSLLHRRAPLYPFMIGAIYYVFGEHPFLVQLVQTVLFAGTSVLAFDLGRRIYNLRTGVIAGALCAVHPALLRYVADFHLETLFTFLLTASVLLGVRFYEKPSVGRAGAFGVMSALIALTKAVAVLFPPLFLLLVDQLTAFSFEHSVALAGFTGRRTARNHGRVDRPVDRTKLRGNRPFRAHQHRLQ